MSIQYLNLDFDSIKESIKDYLRANSNFTDYDFEGSNLSILIDLLAYTTYVNSYNTNMVANESFLNTASIRDNIISHAENMGYVPRSARAARAKINFSVPFTNQNNSSSLTLKKGIVALSNSEDDTYVFSILEDITKPISNLKAIFDSVEILEGNLITQKFTVDPLTTNQRYVLNNENIDTTTITVKVKKSETEDIFTTYNQVDNIIGADSDTPIFIVKEVRDENYEIIFGDGLIGKSLTSGNIVEVSYIVTNGEDGNGIFNYILNASMQNDLGESISSTGIIPILDQSSIGGATIEGVNSIKKYAGRYLSAQNRVVTSTDYETLIPKIFPKAKSAVAYGGETLSPPQYGKVFISIKPDNFSFLSLFDKNFIKEELKKYSPLGIDIEIEDLKYLYIELDITAYYNSSLTNAPDSIGDKITKSITSYSKNEDLSRFGGRFKYSNLVRVIDTSDESITSNTTQIKIRRDLIPEFNSYFSYELCFGNSLFAPLNTSYNVKSTGFKVVEYTDTVYITDLATSNNIGNLLLISINSDNTVKILNDKIGTVNYSTGELFIDSLNIISTSRENGVVEIECIPSSYDILGLRDLFLNLSVNESTITIIRDDISSGSDRSGVNFIQVPQYNKKGFYRE